MSPWGYDFIKLIHKWFNFYTLTFEITVYGNLSALSRVNLNSNPAPVYVQSYSVPWAFRENSRYKDVKSLIYNVLSCIVLSRYISIPLPRKIFSSICCDIYVSLIYLWWCHKEWVVLCSFPSQLYRKNMMSLDTKNFSTMLTTDSIRIHWTLQPWPSKAFLYLLFTEQTSDPTGSIGPIKTLTQNFLVWVFFSMVYHISTLDKR